MDRLSAATIITYYSLPKPHIVELNNQTGDDKIKGLNG